MKSLCQAFPKNAQRKNYAAIAEKIASAQSYGDTTNAGGFQRVAKLADSDE